MNPKKRPCPEDFAKKAPTMSIERLVKHYRTSRIAVRRWLAETGAPCLSVNNVSNIERPVPDDFAQVAPTMTFTALRRHYQTGEAVVRRWIKQSGVSAKRHVPRWNGGYKLPHGHFVEMRNYSAFDEAADILRRERFPVNRCDERGRYEQAGDFWRVGWSVLTPDELLERADRYRRRAA